MSAARYVVLQDGYPYRRVIPSAALEFYLKASLACGAAPAPVASHPPLEVLVPVGRAVGAGGQ
jgi:hypothetical protein